MCQKYGCFKASPDCCHERPSLVPQKHTLGACFAARVHQGIKVVKAPCTSLHELIFDYFAMQQLQQWEECQVRSRQPVRVFVLLSTFVST
jgi:hypothetical protein